MSTELCNYGGYCVRVVHHRGVHTAAPSAATLDWDPSHTRPVQIGEIDAAVTLLMLDLPTPYWAVVNDPLG